MPAAHKTVQQCCHPQQHSPQHVCLQPTTQRGHTHNRYTHKMSRHTGSHTEGATQHKGARVLPLRAQHTTVQMARSSRMLHVHRSHNTLSNPTPLPTPAVAATTGPAPALQTTATAATAASAAAPARARQGLPRSTKAASLHTAVCHHPTTPYSSLLPSLLVPYL